MAKKHTLSQLDETFGWSAIGQSHRWVWDGVEVPEYVVRHPEQITIPYIFAEANVEVRRVMIQRFCEVNGEQTFIRESQAQCVDDDPEWGKLWMIPTHFRLDFRGKDLDSKTIPDTWDNMIDSDRIKFEPVQDEPTVFVEVEDSTPEGNGTFKHYFIRVPPTMRTAKQAVAWTFEESEKSYKPKRQT